MNALCYKIVFSKHLGALVAVGEHTTGQGKAAGTGVRTAVYPSSTGSSPSNFVGLLKSISASVALSFVTTGMATAAGPAVNTLPTAYSINSGNVAISSTSSATNAAMTIKQTTDKASVNWQSFSIGSGAAVNIQQNSSNSVLLNRVVGNDPSQIFGKLTANGQVILINPNGVVFGKGGSVTASAFTASTFGLSDQDFANGKYNYTRNGSNTGVTVEDGATISTTAPAGYVALIGASVDNQGNISTKQGAVVLAAGESVALPTAMTDNISVPLSGKVRLELLPSTINAMVSNSGAITTEGGQVLMQAASLSDAVASITMGGRIDTTAPQAGAVTLLADSGQIKVSGSITANSTNASNTGGDIIIGRDEVTGALAKNTDVSGAKLESLGGFIETSGHQLTVDGITVKAANWLLDPDNIDITDAAAPTSGYSKIKASDINAALQTTNVTISTSSGVTTSGSVSYVPTNPGDGNIIVSAPIVKTGSADTSLTLNADNSITVNGRIGKASGDGTTTGKLNVTLTAKGIAAAAANSGGITVNNMIDANGGAVTLTGTNQNSGAGAGVTFGGFSGITAGSYKVEGTKLGTAGNGYGVWFTGASTLSSSGTSLINGVSHSATGAFTAGLMFDNSTTVTLDAGAGSLVAKGSNTAFQTGVRISANGPSTTSVTTKGNVTLGSNDSASTGFTLRSGVLTADSGALTILGKTSYGLHGVSVHDSTASMTSNNGASITINGSASANGWNGVNISGASINAGTTGDISIIGNAANGNGVYTDGGTNLSGNNITIDGTATTTTSGIGVRLNRTGTTNIKANNDLLITGTVKGTGTGNGVHSGGSNVGTAILMTAGGKAIIKGIQSGNANNTSNTVYLSGVRLNTTGDLTIQAEAANSNSLAINMSWETGSLNGYDDSQRMQFRSTSGNVLIQSSQGAIVAAERNNVNISGVNVMLDNTGGNINTSTGAITLGSRTSTR